MKRQMSRMSAHGDEVIAEWDTDTVSAKQLKELETEFNQRLAEGYFAANITEERNELIQRFDPNADILLIPRMQGG